MPTPTTSTPARIARGTSHRRYAPKNKGGCTTCRSRHVRCDQTRPRCSSCKKSRRQCRYPGPHSLALTTESASASASANTKPAAGSAIKVVFYDPPQHEPKDKRPRLSRRLAAHPDHSPAETRALRYFRDVVAERLAGYFDARFWNTVVVRVCCSQGMGSLRHAVVALSSHWENVVVPGMGKRSTHDWECDDFTLKQYTLAITELRRSMETGSKPSTVDLLLSSLLFICLEMFQNHYESALRQLSSGLYLFSDWESKRRKPSPAKADDVSTRNSGDDNEDELETHLAHIFKRLLSQSLLFPVRRLDTRFLIPSLTPHLPRLPSKFTSPDQARDSFNDCISSILHGVQSRSSINQPACETGASFLKEWSLSFADFRARNDPVLTELERRNCIILEMQRLAMYLYALSSSFKSEMEFDEWMPEFRRLVELGRYIVETKRLTVPQGKILHYPKFDIGLIAPLYLVASRCRESSLRREAVWTLRNGPRQEGVWNSAILASLAERIIEIEEDGIEVDGCAGVKVERRLRLEDAAILTAERKIAAVFVKGKKAGKEGEALYEMIPYSG